MVLHEIFLSHPLYKTDLHRHFYTSMELEAFIPHGNNLKPTLPILMGLNHSKVNSCIQFSPAHSNLCIMCIPTNMMYELRGPLSSRSVVFFILLIKYLFNSL